MKKLQILGTGCAKCNALAEAVGRAAAEIGPDHEIEKITDIRQIMSFGVMTTPALVVDGKVVVAGKVPGHDELRALIGAKS
jgi:small redox-active disulfide protein 2